MRVLFERQGILAQNVIFGFFTVSIVIPLYAVTNRIFAERATLNLATPLDHAIPFLPWTILAYAMVYVFVFLPVFVVKHRALFIRICLGFIVCALVATLFFVLLPVKMPRPGVDTQENLFKWGTALNYLIDKPVNCFPSQHVANAVFATLVCYRLNRKIGLWALGASILIAISTLTMKQHFIADVVAGATLAALVDFFMVRSYTEKLKTDLSVDEIIFPPRQAFWIIYLYAILIGVSIVLFEIGLRFPPILPVN